MYSFLKTSLVVMLMLAGRAPVEAATMSSLAQAASNQTGNAANRNRAQFNKDLSGLHQLADIRNDNIAQPYSNFQQLYLLAEQAQQELAILTNQVALLSATQAVVPAIKSVERAQVKIQHKFAGQAEKITDLARSSIIARNSQQLMSAFEKIERNAEILKIKNRFSNPKENGYRDLNLLVRLPKSKMIVEIQLHLNRMQTIKNGAEHDNYVAIQDIINTASLQQRDTSEIEKFKVQQLQQESSALYHAAWQEQLMNELTQPQQKIA